MDRKKKIAMAVELLKVSNGYVNGKHLDGLAFDFQYDEDSIDVYSADMRKTTFYFPETVCRIVKALELYCYVDFRTISFGKNDAGRDIETETIVLHIH